MSPLEQHVRVLCFSRDACLLQTRRMVLASRFEVVAIGSLEEMQKLPNDQRFDVVLLCHTLSREECDLARDIAHRRWRSAKILALSVERSSCLEYADRTIRDWTAPVSSFKRLTGLCQINVSVIRRIPTSGDVLPDLRRRSDEDAEAEPNHLPNRRESNWGSICPRRLRHGYHEPRGPI